MDYQKSAEAILGCSPATEGLNMWNRLGTRLSMTTEAAEAPVTSALTAKQGGQNPRSAAVEAASVTVMKDNVHEEPMDYYHQLKCST